jgi:hypothetical protein
MKARYPGSLPNQHCSNDSLVAPGYQVVLGQSSEMRPFWIDFKNTANPRQVVIVDSTE